MTHLGERLTDFVFAELSARDMDEARQHVATCTDCRQQVEQFERTRSLLKMSPDVEPPRHTVFEFEKPRRFWSWLIPVAATAAVIIAVLIATPMQIQWHDSQLTVTVGRLQQASADLKPVPAPPTQAAAQPIDYDRIARQVEESERPWLIEQLKKGDAEQTRQLMRYGKFVEGSLAYVESQQQAIAKDNVDLAASIQKLAQQRPAQSSEGQ